MQKQLTTHKGDIILLIEVPKCASWGRTLGGIKFYWDKDIFIKIDEDFEIIGTTSTLTDKDVEPFVEEIYGELDGGDDSELYFRNYKIKTDDDYFDNFHFKVPLKSWKSFLQYNDIDLSKEWVVLKILKQ